MAPKKPTLLTNNSNIINAKIAERVRFAITLCKTLVQNCFIFEAGVIGLMISLKISA